jgi:hypothetical protein
MIRLFQLNLFERRDLMAFLRKEPTHPPPLDKTQIMIAFAS